MSKDPKDIFLAAEYGKKHKLKPIEVYRVENELGLLLVSLKPKMIFYVQQEEVNNE